ncbi:PQQ-binding-like beta-propeller repeat protein [Clostridium sp. 'deep sea']|uniref:outer membrane protein assembly factor BamB family protein n=1 Tax=Clostridium sp. 'deep sea' TaxID=2779445 RepID=UPI0018969E33|nr:PQQ-binding-like beta-propeller repeat protein [Clostridium sp. 'deep sea']QOR35889.1 PQQ-binding-like beta-propeller repeat protein [Clostridium sp. 'deep sea']
MSKMNRNKLMIGGFIVLTAIIVVVIIAVTSTMKQDTFKNVINLNEISNVKVNGNVNKKWLITKEGVLYCATTKEINIIDINTKKTLKTIGLQNKISNFNVVNNNEYVYFVINDNELVKIYFKTLEHNLFEYERDSLINQNVFLYKDKLVMTGYKMYLKVLDLTKNEITSNKVDFFRVSKIYNDILYCWGEGNSIYAYDIKTLKLTWKYVESTSRTSPGIGFGNNSVYFNNTYTTHILNSKTGKKIKSYNLHAQDIDLVDDKMFTVIWGESMSRVSQNNGEKIWTKAINRYGYFIDNDYLIANDYDDYRLRQFDINSGELIWEKAFINRLIDSFNRYKNYYVGKTFRGGIHVINSETGQELWRYKTYTSDDVSNYQIYQDKLIITDGTDEIKIFQLPE